MAAADHNPTRRALLGAAVGLPLSLGTGAAEARGPLHQPPPGHAEVRTAAGSPPGSLGIPRPGEEQWAGALVAFRAAQAEVRRIEAATAGRSAEEEEAWLPAHDFACAAMDDALAALLAAPAPNLPALAAKLELLLAHAVEPGAVEDEYAEAVLADSRRLLSG
jgi:hypothetical protein